ncbi:MAG: HAMP domain-containing histidine kinase [Clostridiales bacterium]|nr:HAMP domain-containing histidine kinase [Clostridiales bacterium]
MRKKEQKHRFALTILYSGVIICVQLAALLIASIVIYIFMRLGILTEIGIPEEGVIRWLMFMIATNTVVGATVAAFTSKIPLRPINRIINQLNTLASGNYKTRLEFGKPIGNHPTFVELTNSFNTLAQELENTEVLRSDFINNFSHEFKTPIVSVAGFAKLLRRGNLSEEQAQEYLAIIEEEAVHLADMATNVLNLTKIENQTILSDVSEYNLSEQIRSCVLMLENKWSRKNLSLDLQFDEYKIRGSEELLKHVWTNLLDNAIKFSPPTGELVVRIEDGHDNICVSVTNFGSEIPAEKQDKIFHKFYQADESHASAGNGIGLAIVKQVADLHGGKVSVESADDKTTFTVSLPKK